MTSNVTSTGFAARADFQARRLARRVTGSIICGLGREWDYTTCSEADYDSRLAWAHEVGAAHAAELIGEGVSHEQLWDLTVLWDCNPELAWATFGATWITGRKGGLR